MGFEPCRWCKNTRSTLIQSYPCVYIIDVNLMLLGHIPSSIVLESRQVNTPHVLGIGALAERDRLWDRPLWEGFRESRRCSGAPSQSHAYHQVYFSIRRGSVFCTTKLFQRKTLRLKFALVAWRRPRVSGRCCMPHQPVYLSVYLSVGLAIRLSFF